MSTVWIILAIILSAYIISMIGGFVIWFFKIEPKNTVVGLLMLPLLLLIMITLGPIGKAYMKSKNKNVE